MILEQNHYDKTYSECSWDKPKTGTGIYGVFWNPEKENGLGDIDIKCQDIMNIFWEPGIADIQKSKEVFTTELVDAEELEQLYPQTAMVQQIILAFQGMLFYFLFGQSYLYIRILPNQLLLNVQ